MLDGLLKEKTLLTLKCATSPSTGKPVDAEYSDGGKLYFVVPKAGQRRWIFKFRWPNADGKNETKRMGLGTLELVPQQRARELAYEARKLLANGINPMDQATRPGVVQVKKTAPTFLEFCAKIRARTIHGMAEKSVQRWDRGVNVYAKSLHTLPIDTITKHEIQACLEPIWLEIQVAAKKFQGQLYDIFKVAIAADVYPEDKRNPADWEVLQKLLAKQDHEETSHKSLDYRELPAAWQRIVAIESMASWTAQWAILNGVRTGEALQVRKDAVVPFLDDEEGAKWLIPGKVMKNGRQANVPLSQEAIALVRKVIAWQEYHGIADKTELLFPGAHFSEQQSEGTVLRFLQEQVGLDTTTHGCRSTLRSWGGDQEGIDRDALEHCLHHILGDTAEAAYNKADQWNKRQKIFQAWADYATGKHAPKKVGRPDLKVVAA